MAAPSSSADAIETRPSPEAADLPAPASDQPAPPERAARPDQSQAASQLAGASVLTEGSRLDDGPGASAAGNSVAALSMLGRTAPSLSTVGPGASGRLHSSARPVPTDGPPPWLGKRVGRFRLMGLIGRGAMGKVFRAEDVQLHRQVALKVISSRSSRKRTAAQKWELFLREARSAAKLEHPNIVSVYEVASASDIHFIAMELVEGGNLKDLVTAAGPLDIPRACQLAAEAAEGLQHAHDNGVVHRDVKPANLMLTRTGRCKLGDFGLARIDDGSDSTGDGGLGSRVGTPQYVAPEVIEGEEATALSDVYSLGATLFFLLTGVPPFSGTDSREVMRKHVEELPPDVRTLRPEVPESLALAVWRAMSKHPTARFESAGHFARALRIHTIQTEGTEDLPDRFGANATARNSASANTQLPVDRRRMALIGVLGGGLLLAMVIGAAGIVSRSANNTAARTNSNTPLTLPTLPKLPGTTATQPATLPSDTTEELTPPTVPLPAEGETLAATDTAKLLRVAMEPDPSLHSGHVIIQGWVQRVAVRRDGPGWLIEFRSVDRRRGLLCLIDSENFDHDIVSPESLRNKKIEVRGEIELADGRPMILCRPGTTLALLDSAGDRPPYAFPELPATRPAVQPAATQPVTTQPTPTTRPAVSITPLPPTTQPARTVAPATQPATQPATRPARPA